MSGVGQALTVVTARGADDAAAALIRRERRQRRQAVANLELGKKPRVYLGIPDEFAGLLERGAT